ncbi:2-hydroxyacid dehydrogenase [Dactylosporangium fulvum]|uniref:2-hydroxyacid dehydrogenase n=1 Tax=Dactylosporangium fulvum TaxID=53359 RepID=A0ABY5W181_9ACTN|nr:2-hydroxyacid dehydrogenase [Dactylosporangium fulvum]UWP83121.1 2-hydroxyacid dehydrogenase [Dactylosporangium fulvum]
MADPMQVRLAEQLTAEVGEGVSWDFSSAHTPEALPGALVRADVFVGSKLPPSATAQADALRLVQVAGAGYEGIDLAGLRPGTIVANTTHHGRAIAEYCVMAMLALHRQLLVEDADLRAGRWRSVFQDPDAPVHRTLVGQTVGIVGYGEIGQHVAELCHALGMRVIATRRRPTPAPPADWIGGPDELPRLLRDSDVVVVTVPLSDETVGLLDAAMLAELRPSAFLINVSRGPVVDETALHAALTGGRLAGAAIDVWWRYPTSGRQGAPANLPFHELTNVIMTPHTSGVTHDVFTNRMRDVAANIRALRDGQPLRNVVHQSPPEPTGVLDAALHLPVGGTR